ncbi:MAG: ABC transporter ATP-binding protein [Magnetococcales bacterium]|nr:ABC transporter ATP-binding protein [Magnetococcales bacterium]
MSHNAIAASGVCKRFDGQFALDGLSLSVAAGEFFGLVGGNGAGKTTLIKCILDFCHMDDGTIEIFGRRRADVQARAALAYLPERFSPPHFLTGREFLRTMAQFYDNPWDNAAAEELSIGLDMEPTALDKPIRALSKGMTQKLGLAASLLSGRALLLLDEPMSGLDPQARILLKRRLVRLKQQQGTTLFFNTHLLADVAEICDRMGVLHRGRLCFVGTPTACMTRYGGATLEESYLHCIQAETASRAPAL